MLKTLFSRLAPHYCLSCGEIGRQICDNCFFDIEMQARETCLRCHGLLTALQCSICDELRGVTQVVLAERGDVLGRLVDEYKFLCTRETSTLIAKFLDSAAPHFPTDAVLVPIPTSPAHVRRRGFDHTRDIVSEFARLRHLSYSQLLTRQHNLAQFGAGYHERQTRAQEAFGLSRESVATDKVYIVCDDIVTTGASMAAAVAKLREAGATRIIVLALLQQPWKNPG